MGRFFKKRRPILFVRPAGHFYLGVKGPKRPDSRNC
jgi:hypothetical protein